MNNALIGHSGFVGGTLKKQTQFQHYFRSTDIEDIRNNTYDTIVCAGAPAQKWLANKDPIADEKKISSLIEHLKTVKCTTFILISTVDVFKNPLKVDEDTVVDKEGLHAYGLNRLKLEEFVKANFEKHLIVRLPGLVGPGLRKNIIFDFLNANNLDQIESRNKFQFYPMVNLWADIQIALKHKLSLVHLTTEPISVRDIAEQGFNIEFSEEHAKPLVNYDMQSKNARIFSGSDKYQYSIKESLLAVRAYAQSEPKKSEPV